MPTPLRAPCALALIAALAATGCVRTQPLQRNDLTPLSRHVGQEVSLVRGKAEVGATLEAVAGDTVTIKMPGRPTTTVRLAAVRTVRAFEPRPQGKVTGFVFGLFTAMGVAALLTAVADDDGPSFGPDPGTFIVPIGIVGGLIGMGIGSRRRLVEYQLQP